MMPLEFSKEATNPIFIVLIYGIFILFAYLLYVLFHGVYKKRIHKNYMYSYLAFFPIFIVFYFGYYIQYDRGEYIPESTFETKLQNIEVSEDENGIVQIGKLYTENDVLSPTIRNLDSKIRNHYYCITGQNGKKCEEENLEKTLELYNLDIGIIDIVHNNFSKIVDYKYFKQEIKGDLISLQGLSTISRISLFSAINELEKGNEDKAIEILLIYNKLGEKLLLGDNSLVGTITGVTIETNIINNINYILDNYNLKEKNLNLLKIELSKMYDSQDIFANTLKFEYWLNKYGFEEGFENGAIKSNMFLNKEELYNNFRKLRLSNINGEGYYYENKPKNYFKREFIYRMFGSMAYFGTEGYKEDIENINIERKKVIEKIDLQLNK
ncbi:MAG: hypothetical protein PHS49_06725 [Candidatus Gracilibacteria bacterium]|nr:hypothetical protein [Candidatus Gracilibacteria bacterium]